MQFIEALSLTPKAKDWLGNSRHPRILHVFDSVCNLINERREVLSLVTPQIGNGPFNLVIQDCLLFSEHLRAESPVSVLSNQITLENLTIHTAAASLWNPYPDWEKLHAKRNVIFDQLTQLLLPHYQPQLPNPLLNTFCVALASADLPASLTAAKNLAGLGIGLTPAGDDFMMGTIYAAWIIHPREIASVLAKEITDTAVPLTTSLSAAWLKSAGKGETGILWHNFFDALASTHPVQIQKAANHILAVGETSGADALSGFIGTFISFGESEAKLCLS